jgi:nicotinamide mononucleotide (NMN) deamidase PncC
MVCFGLAWREAGKVRAMAHTQHFSGDRHQVRRASVQHVLQLVQRHLDSLFPSA